MPRQHRCAGYSGDFPKIEASLRPREALTECRFGEARALLLDTIPAMPVIAEELRRNPDLLG